MEILIVQYDPHTTKVDALVTQLLNAKHGAVVLCPPGVKFEVLTLESPHMGEVMFGVSKNGSQVKILYDPEQEGLRIQKVEDAKRDYGKEH